MSKRPPGMHEEWQEGYNLGEFLLHLSVSELLDPKRPLIEKIIIWLIGELDAVSHGNEGIEDTGCHVPTDEFAEFFKMPVVRFQKIIKRLEKEGVLECLWEEPRGKSLRVNWDNV